MYLRLDYRQKYGLRSIGLLAESRGYVTNEAQLWKRGVAYLAACVERDPKVSVNLHMRITPIAACFKLSPSAFLRQVGERVFDASCGASYDDMSPETMAATSAVLEEVLDAVRSLHKDRVRDRVM